MRHFLKRNTVFFSSLYSEHYMAEEKFLLHPKLSVSLWMLFQLTMDPSLQTCKYSCLLCLGPCSLLCSPPYHICNALLSTLVPCFCRCTGSLYWGKVLQAAPDAHFLLPSKLYVPVYTMTISIGTEVAYGIFNNCVCLYLIVNFYILFKSKNGPYIIYCIFQEV